MNGKLRVRNDDKTLENRSYDQDAYSIQFPKTPDSPSFTYLAFLLSCKALPDVSA